MSYLVLLLSGYHGVDAELMSEIDVPFPEPTVTLLALLHAFFF